jgi:hypothetical protein
MIDLDGKTAPLTAEFLQTLREAIEHQNAHGPAFIAAPVGESFAVVIEHVCPDSVIVICGSNVLARVLELRTEARVVLGGVDEAAAEIERLRKGC